MITANENENWEDIPGWENEYRISESGRVFSIRRNREMKVWTDGVLYPRVSLTKNNKSRSFTIHRLVAKAFIPNPHNKVTVNHKDGNKQNCHVSNLEWATFSENQTHAVFNGLAKAPELPNGENHPASKLSDVDIEMIKVLSNSGFNYSQISKRFDVCASHISLIVRGKSRTGQELEVKLPS